MAARLVLVALVEKRLVIVCEVEEPKSVVIFPTWLMMKYWLVTMSVVFDEEAIM